MWQNDNKNLISLSYFVLCIIELIKSSTHDLINYLLDTLTTESSTTQRFHSTTILIISVIITFVLTVIITSILTIVITIIITYCIMIKIYSRSDENTEDYYTDIQPPAQINTIYDEVEEQRDPTTTNNPSYQPTMLTTEV